MCPTLWVRLSYQPPTPSPPPRHDLSFPPRSIPATFLAVAMLVAATVLPRPCPRPSQLLHACRPPTHTHLPPPPHHNRLRNGRSSGRTARTLVPSLARRAMHSRRKGAHSPPHLPRRTPREAEAAPDLPGPPTRTRTLTLVSNFGRPLFARAGEGSSSLSGERVCQRLSRRGGWVAALCPQRIFACPEVGSARLEAIGRR